MATEPTASHSTPSHTHPPSRQMDRGRRDQNGGRREYDGDTVAGALETMISSKLNHPILSPAVPAAPVPALVLRARPPLLAPLCAAAYTARNSRLRTTTTPPSRHLRLSACFLCLSPLTHPIPGEHHVQDSSAQDRAQHYHARPGRETGPTLPPRPHHRRENGTELVRHTGTSNSPVRLTRAQVTTPQHGLCAGRRSSEDMGTRRGRRPRRACFSVSPAHSSHVQTPVVINRTPSLHRTQCYCTSLQQYLPSPTTRALSASR